MILYLEERITGRWIHPSSGWTYHTKFAPSKVPGVDDISSVTGEPLIQRKDDTPAFLKSRLEAFHKQTEPVIDYYAKKGVLAELHAENPPKDVTVEVQKAVFVRVRSANQGLLFPLETLKIVSLLSCGKHIIKILYEI